MKNGTLAYDPIEFMELDMGMWKCIILIAIMAVVFRVASFFCLKYLVTKFQ